MTADFLPAVPPVVTFFVGALLVALTSGRLRALLSMATPILSFFSLLAFEPGTSFVVPLLDFDLTLMRVDRLSLLFGYLFHLAALIGVVYALHVKDRIQQFSALAYAGSALAAVFAGDLITLFIAWELLALTSVALIFARRTERAIGAGLRYLVISVLSGVLLLAGALFRVHETGGDTSFGLIGLDGGIGCWLIFLAFGIKCAFPGLHSWLVDSYPEATPTGTVFLSAFTTKVAVYALARGYPGTELLVYIGAAMTAFPIFYAVIENDLRRVLAYSMINQIGFMVVGIGIGTSLAINGAVAHAFNDVIFKGLLFMSMGAVLHQTGRICGSDLGGLYKTMPKTTVLCCVGAASISAFPLFSGFVSKSMVMAAALESGHPIVWLVLLFAAAGVFHHAGIKIPFFAFFAHDSGIRTKEPPWNMLLAMTIGAALCIFLGSYPAFLYGMLPGQPVEYVPYTASHVLTQTQILFFSALAFCFLMRTGLYPPELHSVNLDADWTYRRLGTTVALGVGRGAMTVYRFGLRFARAGIDRGIAGIRFTTMRSGLFARTVPTGTSALWAALLLGVVLLLYYL